MRLNWEKRDAEGNLLASGKSKNLKTNAGLNFILAQAYSASGAAGTGLAYVACSTDTSVTETATSTTLSNEITTNGLARHIGTFTSTGTGTCTISYQFTATGSVTCGKVALFSAAISGTMNHVLVVSPAQPLVNTNTFTVTFTITLT